MKFEAFGTELEVEFLENIPQIIFEKVKLDILNYTYDFDEKYSRFKENSLVTSLSKKTGVFKVPTDFVEMLEIYKILNQKTNGIINPLIGNTISDLGYDAKYSLRPKENIRPTPEFSKTVEIIDKVTIKLNELALIDVGAIGKGFWVDKIKNILLKNNIHDFLVNGSGDIFFNSTEINIGLENPFEGGLIGTVKLKSGEAICGSATNKRNWSVNLNENLNHEINPLTQESAKNIVAVWVKANNTAYADGLATALFFCDANKLQEDMKDILNFEYLIIDQNKKILMSENFNAKILNN